MSFIQELFEFIRDVGELMPGILEGKYQYARRLRRATYYGSLSRLQKQGLIRKINHPNGNLYKVTLKGKKYNFPVNLPAPVVATKRFDGLLTTIIFDIPEYLKRDRNRLRRWLKTAGFNQLQKSIFVSEYMLPDELKQVVQLLGLKKYVRVLSSILED